MVKDKNGKPIVGAIIVLNGGVRVFTGEGGYFHALLAPGLHNIEAVADGYQQQSQKVSVYFCCVGLFFCFLFVCFVCVCGWVVDLFCLPYGIFVLSFFLLLLFYIYLLYRIFSLN